MRPQEQLFELIGAAGFNKEAVIELRKLLTKRAVNINQLCAVEASTSLGRSPLIHAVVRSNLETVQLLVNAGADVNGRDADGMTPLMHAADRSRWDMVPFLLDHGADPNLVQNGTEPPLSYVAAKVSSPDGIPCIRALLAAGADANRFALDADGEPSGTPLMVAAQNGNVPAIRELVSAGADVNVVVPFGTALAQAAEEEHLEAVQFLLASGAHIELAAPKVNGIPTSGMTPLEIARQRRNRKLVQLLEAAGQNGEHEDEGMREGNIKEAWARLYAALHSHNRLRQAKLRPGVSLQEIARLEKVIGHTLPSQWRALARICNGQSASGKEFIPSPSGHDGGFRLLTFDEISAEWKDWKTLVDGGEFTKSRSMPDKGIRAEWYNLGWIPLAADGGGNLICVDLVPAKGKGKVGQIISVRHDAGTRKLLADSLAEWIKGLAEHIE